MKHGPRQQLDASFLDEASSKLSWEEETGADRRHEKDANI